LYCIPIANSQVAFSFLKIANDKMAEAVKKVTEAKGYDVV
jgi:N-methylhydantoinase A/oxoprolinase/acetone carboxylase beta subunit